MSEHLSSFEAPKDPLDLLREINADMHASEVIARIKRFNTLTQNQTHDPVIEARLGLLQNVGEDPETWVYYTNWLEPEPGTDITVEMDGFFKVHFPTGVQYLAVQSNYRGGMTIAANSIGIATYKYGENGYTVFVREAPSLLEASEE